MRRGRRTGVRLLGVCLTGLTLAACASTYTDAAMLDGVEGAPSGRTLVVTGIHGGCDTPRPAEVTETAAEVRVRVPLEVRRGDCRSIGLTLRVEVELEEPLGDRAVVDAERGEPLPVVARGRS